MFPGSRWWWFRMGLVLLQKKTRFGKGGRTNASDVGKLTEMESTQTISWCALTLLTCSFGLCEPLLTDLYPLYQTPLSLSWRAQSCHQLDSALFNYSLFVKSRYDHKCLTNPATAPTPDKKQRQGKPPFQDLAGDWTPFTYLLKDVFPQFPEEWKGLSSQLQPFSIQKSRFKYMRKASGTVASSWDTWW